MSQHSHLYNNRKWRALRARQLTLEPLCRYCMKQGKVVEATVCDHIVPHKGDIDAFWNGERQSLCKTCHDSVKQREEAGRTIVSTGLDGWPVG